MSIRRSGGRSKSKSNRSLSRSRSNSKVDDNARSIVSATLQQLKYIDPLYMGSLGIKFKYYGVDKDTGNVEMAFDASTVIIDGKQYRQKNWIVITYNDLADSYEVHGVHWDYARNQDRIESERYTGLDAEQLYRMIHTLTQQ